MDKLNMETPNLTDKNIEKILELFPNVATEKEDKNGKLKIAVDFDKLKQELLDNIVDGEESYDFTWVGKREAMVESNRPIRKTLRPDRESSVNWDTTENLYIEGDNLDALKLLQESYLNQVKMIYIDPPYNTGNDFVYRDNFTQDKESYEEELGLADEEGNRLFLNTETNGRFHSDWCSMIYSRLKLAKNLLTDDGVIFISIDDNEVANLRKICDEILGEANYVQEIIWQKKFSPQNDAKYFSLNHEQILCYAKNKEFFNRNLLPMTEEQKKRYRNPDNDPRGIWTSGDISVGRITEKDIYPIKTPSGREVYPPEGNSWRFSKDKIQELINDNRIWFGENGDNVPRVKRFLSETNQGIVPISLWYHNEVGHTQSASQDLKKIFDGKAFFDYPKPVDLIKKNLLLSTNDKSIILDFFSGSATTAHACMQLNADDSGNRKFIMVQLPEPLDEKSEAYKAGYKNICEIGKERIRRAGKKIQEENTDKKIDIGFRVLKVDDTNMKDVYYTPQETDQKTLGTLVSNIKDDRTDEDLLYGVLLDWGVKLSLPHKIEEIDGKRVHIVNNDDLVACFESSISEIVIRKIAEKKPTRVVFRDGSFNTDDHKINVEEIFKLLAPDTTVKVI